MLLGQSDIRPSIRENESQTPPSLALPEGHAGVARILLGLGDVNSKEASNGGQASLPPSARPADELVEMQFSSHDPNPDTTNFNTQPRLIPGAHGEQLRLPNLRVLFQILQLTAPQPTHPGGPGFFPSGHEGFHTSRNKTTTHPNNH